MKIDGNSVIQKFCDFMVVRKKDKKRIPYIKGWPCCYIFCSVLDIFDLKWKGVFFVSSWNQLVLINNCVIIYLISAFFLRIETVLYWFNSWMVKLLKVLILIVFISSFSVYIYRRYKYIIQMYMYVSFFANCYHCLPLVHQVGYKIVFSNCRVS